MEALKWSHQVGLTFSIAVDGMVSTARIDLAHSDRARAASAGTVPPASHSPSEGVREVGSLVDPQMHAFDGSWEPHLAIVTFAICGEADRTPSMIHIRPATEADFEAILNVQRAAFGEYATIYEVSAWTTETLDSLRQDAKDKRIFVAEMEGAVIGSVRYWTVAGVCVIRLLSVSPDHQKHGAGKALLREIEQVTTDAHKFYACTMLRTARNIQFFLSLGYKAETVLPDHYHHVDLICFAKYREPTKTATPSPA